MTFLIKVKGEGCNMISKIFNCIDKMIDYNEKNPHVKDKISAKEKELGITLPSILKEFYMRYSGNEKILNSFYILKDIDKLKVEEDVLIIGYSNQFINKYGIRIGELTNNSINVNLLIGKEEWMQYEDLNDFIINVTVFQVINMLESSAQLDDSEIILEEFFIPLNKLDNSDVKIISYISKNKKILASHFSKRFRI